MLSRIRERSWWRCVSILMVLVGCTSNTPPPDPPIPVSPGEIPEVSTTEVPSRALFEGLSRRDNVPGAIAVREVKFLVTGVDTANPTLHFINSNTFEYHYDFASQGLGLRLSLREFNAQTYFTDNRRFLAGSILAHDSFEHPQTGRGIYTVEFWPTDPVKVRHVDLAYQRVVAGLPFATGKVHYHPASETQRSLHLAEKAEFDQRRIQVVRTEDLFANVAYAPLNPGEGYGLLRVMEATADGRPASVRDVVIFRSLPNDLSHVAGVLSEEPQTPLSHVNLKAKQNDTPNAYVKGASTHPRIAPLLDKWVHYVVGPDDFVLEEATPEEVERFLAEHRPKEPQIPVRDLSRSEIAPLAALGHADARSVGVKAANVAELRKILPPAVAPDGYGIPFWLYDRFMTENGFYEAARAMAADSKFQGDPEVREDELKKLRKRIEKAPVPGDVMAKLETMHAALRQQHGPQQPIRLRSSTNNEDLEGFSGAGLYDSKTHRPDEGAIETTVKEVWASLWNYRAFEEREFYRIPHEQAAMGVLAHPNFDDELANGVAVTKNVFDPNWPGFYVNVQAGESLVTNPDEGVTPDEFLVARLGPEGEYEIQYVRRSSILPPGQETILTTDQVAELVAYMEQIQVHFARVYGREDDPDFAMDIEFKVTAEGMLAIKQARPWVD